LSIGEEDVKGNDITKRVFSLLKECKAINFIGNVEAKELYKGKADVIVCDGFVGNIALKTSEAVASFVYTLLKRELKRNFISKLGALLMLPGLKRFKKHVDYEEYGGAPLLGVNGICLIGHGSSSANAVKNAVRVAKELVEEKMNEEIAQGVKSSFNLIDPSKQQ
jgi:glycerol-3-phosphate acyltransferase PlsX